MVYPFAPAFARGLGVPLADIYRLIALRNVTGFFSPLFSPLSERYGRVPVMVGATVLFVLGCLVVVIWPAYWACGATLAIIGLGKIIYDPAMQSYIGERVPYGERGKAISITELSWAGALLIGAPAVSLAISRQGWQTPFFWLALFGLVGAVALWRFLPRTFASGVDGAVNLRRTAQVLLRYRVIWAAMGYTTCIMAANETLLIVFGDWMESMFGLGLVALGFSAGVIGGAEVAGELTAGWSVDKFGKRSVIVTSGLVTAVASLCLPLTGGNLTLALLAYFVLFLFFEITVVGGVPLLTEIVPSARAVVMSSVIAAAGLGRVIGAWLGPFLFSEVGFIGNGLSAAILTSTGVILLYLWVKEGSAAEDSERASAHYYE
jgi:predicted MFS family arabinose efflux permease